MRDAREARRPAPALHPTPPAAVDIPDQIRKLSLLRDEGVLTAEEFESKKAELLSRM